MNIKNDILAFRQKLPLDIKIKMSKTRIKQFYNAFNGMVYVSFSGGKDSTVLLHLVRSIFPETTGVFSDTGLEFPEIRNFVKSVENIKIIKPEMSFKKVIYKYGYPIVSKEVAQKIYEIRNTKSDKLKNKRLYGDHKGNGKIPEKWKYLINAPFKISGKCCDVLKKTPFKKFEKESGLKPIVGTMASDSRLRKTNYLKNGCNSFDSKRPMSLPLSFWNENDIWEYINKFNLDYSSIYEKGYDRTGCMFCMFGLNLDKVNRFEKMKKTHIKQYNYCMDKLGLKDVLSYVNKRNNYITIKFDNIEEMQNVIQKLKV